MLLAAAAGWYCFIDTNPCICNFAGVMPATLQATFGIALAETIYLPQISGSVFGTTQYRSCKITSAEAQAVSQSVVLSRVSSITGPTCEYIYSDGGLTIRVQAGGANVVTIAVGFAISYQELTSGVWGCQNDSTVGLSLFTMSGSIACTASSSQSTKAAWTNASSVAHSISSNVSFPGFKDSDSEGVHYTDGFWFDLTQQGVTVSPCVPKPAQSISGSWAFDLLYTDVSGPNRVNRRLSRACTLTVTQ